MKHLQHLRSVRKRLTRLRHRRQRFRWATAASAVGIAVLWTLAGIFVLDWYFQRNLDLLQRLLLLGLGAAAVIWAFVRFARPWLGKQEDITDMALLVQRQTGIDTDLVAALQFESDDAARWGSTQLETAVIDRVAAQHKHLNVMSAMPRQPLARRWKVLLASVLAWGLLGAIAPHYVWIFLQRLALSSQHYPSRTEVVAITVNGKHVNLAAPGEEAVHVTCGQPVRFEVTVEGSQPASGRIELALQARGSAAHVPLARSSDSDEPTAQGQYRGEYPALRQSARYQIYLGDAWTDPLLLSVTPLPVVEVEAEVLLPVYARQSAQALQKLPRGMRQFAVLAGSEVHLSLHSDRPLKTADIKIDDQTYAMQPATDATDPAKAATSTEQVWTLAVAGTPLASVAKELNYSIQVHDPEGQTLDQPLEGSIAMEPDLPPGIIVSTKTPIVLPTGSPSIHYEAADDHALSCIWLTWEATAADTSQETEKREGRIEVCRFSPEASPRNREGNFPMALQSLPLKPGDTLKVTFHVSDYRGPSPAETVDADPPLVFQVTDLHGFEASMYEADQKSAGVLEDIRRKHSGLGETQ